MTTTRLLITAAAAACIASPGGLDAQGVDYGSLQDLFGQPVTLSGNGAPQLEQDVSLPMDIITQEDIARSGATTVPDILDRYTNVSVWRKSVLQADVSIRGNNQNASNRLLVLVNRRQIFTTFFNNTFWPAMPVQLSEIRQIEVVRGPNVALFGFNAVGGVINIVTFDPLYDDVNQVTARFGNLNYYEGGAAVTARIGEHGGVRISGGYKTSEDYSERFEDRPSTNPAFQFNPRVNNDPVQRNIAFDASFRVNEAVTARLEGGFADYVTALNIPQGSDRTVDSRTMSIKGELVAETALGRTALIGYHNHAGYEVPGSLPPTELLGDEALTSIRLENTVTASANVFRGGVEFRAARNNSNRLFADLINTETRSTENGRVGYNVYSGDAMWNRRWTSYLDTSLAARIDYVRLQRGPQTIATPTSNPAAIDGESFVEYSFNASALIKPSDDDRIRLIAARGVSIPSLVELGANSIDLGPPLNTNRFDGIANPPRSSTLSFEAGYERRVPALNANFGVGTYYQFNKDFSDVGGTIPVEAGDNQVLGFEFEGDGAIPIPAFGAEINWRANYALNFVTDDNLNPNVVSPAANTPTFNNTLENQTSRHNLNAMLGVRRGPATFDIYADYRSDFTALGFDGTLEEIQDVFVLGVSAGYTLFEDRVRLGLNADQLNAAQQEQNTGREVDRRIVGSVDVKF